MSVRARAYELLPRSVRPVVRSWYQEFHPGLLSDDAVGHAHDQFVERYFDSRAEYEGYIDELHTGAVHEFVERAADRSAEVRGTDGIGNAYLHDVYAYLRHHRPDVVVETGVRDGWSTLYLLAALDRNDHGRLHSVDYPIREGTDEAAYVREAPSYEGGTPTIPAGEDPGWIVPEALTDRWELHLGKSQDVLPRLFCELDAIDVFIHDSDHSLPCMMFEFELAWEWLTDGGLLFSDDIDWNDGFAAFVDSKGSVHGRTSRSFGYVEKR